jgi:hypothetical protein
MRPTNELFEIGDRVRLNMLGESRFRRTPSKTGKVVGFGFSGARIRVLFDGLSQPTTLHQSYLEKDPELTAVAHADANRVAAELKRRTKN